MLDKRHVTTNKGIFEALMQHLRFTTNRGQVIPTITVFPQKRPGKTGPRVWNPQVVRYAAYPKGDGVVVGDPAHIELTKVCTPVL